MDENIMTECLNGKGNAYGKQNIEKRSLTSLIQETFNKKNIRALAAVALVASGISGGVAMSHSMSAEAANRIAESQATELSYQHQLGQETLAQSGQECYLVGPMRTTGSQPEHGDFYQEKIIAMTVDPLNNNKPHCEPQQYDMGVKKFSNWNDALKEYTAHQDVHFIKPISNGYTNG